LTNFKVICILRKNYFHSSLKGEKMGRREYDDELCNDFLDWLKDFVTPESHFVTLTKMGEIIIQPRKSTSIYDHGYAKLSAENRRKIIDFLKNEKNFEKFYPVTAYRWKIETDPAKITKLMIIEQTA